MKFTSAVKTVTLSSGYQMPIVGFGSAGIKESQLEEAVLAALNAGYGHIDTAFVYGNEELIGKTLKKWFANGGKREDLFITSKLPQHGNRPADVEKYLKSSLDKLGLNYLDMYLIHKPFTYARKNDRLEAARTEDGRVILEDTDPLGVWKEMEKLVRTGRVRSIGFSNFNETQVENIMNHAEIKPSNLQIEIHEYFQQKPIRKFCNDHNIVVTAFAPLGSPGLRVIMNPNQTESNFPDLLKHPVVSEIGKKYNKSNAQVMLRHFIQDGLVIIPKSSNPERIRANLDLFDFELTDEDIRKLEGLDMGYKGRIFNYLQEKGIENHPEYPFADALNQI